MERCRSDEGNLGPWYAGDNELGEDRKRRDHFYLIGKQLGQGGIACE